NRVEADSRTRWSNGVPKRREHLVLPFEVLALSKAVAYTERDVVSRNSPQCAVSEDPAEDELLLIVRQRIVLDSDEHLVTLLDLSCRPLTLRSKDHVVRRAREGPSALTTGHFEPKPVVCLTV